MTPGHYTELFFLDEATALAAGHRPCAECQRERFTQFRDLWATANVELAGSLRPAATVLDLALHQERTAVISHADGSVRRCEGARVQGSCMSIDGMPDGVFVTDDERTAYLVVAGRLLRWSPAGYERPTARLNFPVRVVTPASVVRTLAAGYPAGIHDSA